MAKNIDQITISNPLLDSRWKILPCQREMIPKWAMQGHKIKDIALKLGVSYHTIYYILHPEKLEENRKLSNNNYKKNVSTKTIAKHRNKKRNIFKLKIMMYKEKGTGKEYSQEKIKELFDKKRYADDEFARDYARHEIGLWIKKYFDKIEVQSESQAKFKTFANEYNKLRYSMIEYLKGIDSKRKDLIKLNADELLEEIQNLENTQN